MPSGLPSLLGHHVQQQAANIRRLHEGGGAHRLEFPGLGHHQILHGLRLLELKAGHLGLALWG